jgi:hypothetical protein
MSDTPGDQVPDAISSEALRQALGKGFPQATALQAFRFGDTSQRGGAHDLIVLLTLIFSQEGGGPSVVQTIGAAAFLAHMLSEKIRESSDTARQSIERDIERYESSDPARAMAARRALRCLAEQGNSAVISVDRLNAAAKELEGNARRDMAILEIIESRGRMPDPCKRQRFVSDQFLDSVGIDREAFDSYFKSRAGH